MKDTEEFLINLVLWGKPGAGVIEEERGVGASRDYLAAISKIVEFCAVYIQNLLNKKDFNGNWQIDIPSELTEPFDIFGELNIDVKVIDDPVQYRISSGTGNTNTFQMPKMVIQPFIDLDNPESENIKNKYSVPVTISVETYSDGTKLNKGLLSKTLIHEINHKIEEYNQAVEDKNLDKSTVGTVYKQTEAYEVLKAHIPEYCNQVCEIIYHLFSETERNAMVAGIYGELEGLNSTRKDFPNDLKSTNTYDRYKHIEKLVKDLENVPIEDPLWSFLASFFSDPRYKILSPLPKATKITPGKMRKAFLTRANGTLINVFRRLARVASYYYDMQEDSNFQIKVHTREFKKKK